MLFHFLLFHLMLEKIYRQKYILGSASPRRQFLLKDLGLDFEVIVKNTEEDFSPDLKGPEIPLFLSALKADAFTETEIEEKIVITADTVVWVNDTVLNKPADKVDAIKMLRMLSGNMHHVYTAVTLRSKNKKHSFYGSTEVYFRHLSDEELEFYVDRCRPFDKAGAYGAQEWIGYVGVEKIVGSYFNVMGLPLKELYEELGRF